MIKDEEIQYLSELLHMVEDAKAQSAKSRKGDVDDLLLSALTSAEGALIHAIDQNQKPKCGLE